MMTPCPPIARLSTGNLSYCMLAHVSEKNNSYDMLEQLAKFAGQNFGVSTSVLKQRNSYSIALCPFDNILV